VIVTLNIGIDPPSYLPMRDMGTIYRDQCARWAMLQHMDLRKPGGLRFRVDGWTLIAQGTLRRFREIARTSETINQDCIAILFHTTKGDVGCLRGPRAMEWGDFNIRHFKRFWS
jgi:hypothetical protein